MAKHTRGWLILGAILTVIGLGMFAAAMAAQSWNFAELDTQDYQTNTYTMQEPFRSIAMDTETADIGLALSSNSDCTVVCYAPENTTHTVAVENGVLTVRSVDDRKWYDHIGIYSETPKITVYLPGTAYGALTLKGHTGAVEIPKDFHFETIDISTDTGIAVLLASVSDTARVQTATGTIRAENISVGNLYLSTDTGKISVTGLHCTGDLYLDVSTGRTELTAVRCRSLYSDGNTGRITLTDVIAEEALSIKRDTGDVKLEHCDAADIFIETDTGHVTGSFLSPKIFTVEADTGSIKVPDSVTGGICRISTDTGDIAITLDDIPSQ